MRRFSVGLREPEHVLPDERLDEVVADRSRLVEARLSELPLQIVFRREAEATVGIHRRIRGPL